MKFSSLYMLLGVAMLIMAFVGIILGRYTPLIAMVCDGIGLFFVVAGMALNVWTED